MLRSLYQWCNLLVLFHWSFPHRRTMPDPRTTPTSSHCTPNVIWDICRGSAKQYITRTCNWGRSLACSTLLPLSVWWSNRDCLTHLVQMFVCTTFAFKVRVCFSLFSYCQREVRSFIFNPFRWGQKLTTNSTMSCCWSVLTYQHFSSVSGWK